MPLRGPKKLLTAVSSTIVVAAAVSGVSLGVGTATASADVIRDLACEYSSAGGAGTVSSLLNESLTLSSQGFRPTKAQLAAIEESLSSRPNQGPLIKALQTTVAAQKVLQSEQQLLAGQQSPVSIGVVQGDPNDPFATSNPPITSGITIGGGGTYKIGSSAGTVPGGSCG
ncbi:hypothetical protein LV457_14200 [Mycobacterium sp. MYCO198283]|uniref:hypothetical protein n=1 Tax=Mycobacterium sp. MYCO198283 TaxID=2883505 RepID=UPI001E4CFF8F|nr:hypothetical protein [Mycobacterium sp. MYCO198283]MCG5433431.1 hypothetical protein [Mycobacterium sp. MYCO198283]